MRSRSWSCVSVCAVACVAGHDPWVADFDKAAAGPLPTGWKAEGTGAAATWEVLADASSPSPPNSLVLTKVNDTAADAFNLCWTETYRAKDATVEVSLRPLSGKAEQGGGPAWRVKDKNNYYVCTVNPLEGNFRLYVVQDGKRRQLATGAAAIDTAKWHTIKAGHHGEKITCWLDGEKVLEAKDQTLGHEGGVGVWTRGDARTAFDDLRVLRDDALAVK